MERVILHCDLNNFYASCECLKRPELKMVPLVVCGSKDARHGVVLAKNEIAKKAGVKTGDVLWQAQQKIAGLVCMPPDFAFYSKTSKQVFDIYSRYTCYVEPFGADECWLDVTGSFRLFGSGKEIADTLREIVKKETGGLTISAGVSFNKVFAKFASDLKKPDATSVVSKENFKTIVWNSPVGELFMAGKKTAEKLYKINVKTIGDLAVCDDGILKNALGINGLKLKRNALGLDDEPVREYIASRAPLSVGHGMTATKDICTLADAESMIYYLADLVAVRMRKNNLIGQGVAVNLRDCNLKTVSKQSKLESHTKNAGDIGKAAFSLAKSIWNGDPPLRTITVNVYDVVDDKSLTQMSFFDEVYSKNDRLDKALDKIRQKYGSDSIKRANLIEKDFIYDKTDDEDFLPFKR